MARGLQVRFMEYTEVRHNNANGSIYSNSIQISTAGTTGYIYGIYNAGLGTTGISNTLNIYNNTVQNCNQPTSTSSYFYGIYNAASAFNTNFYGNMVNNNVFGGSYYMYLCYTNSGAGGTSNVYNNTISNNSRSGAGTQYGTSYLYCLYAVGSATYSIHDNSIYGNSIGPIGPSYGATIYGLYCSNSSPNQNIYNNTIHDQTITSTYTSSHVMYGLYSSPSSASAGNIYNNSIYNLAINLNSTGYGYIYGLYTYYGSGIYGNSVYNINITNSSSGYGYGYAYYFNGSSSSNNIYKNKLYGVSMAGTSGYFYGMYVASGITMNLYNNYISDLKAPASTSTSALNGIYVSGGTNVNLYYNTIYLDASSTSATSFTTNGIYASTAPIVELRDNIVINKSTAPGSTTYVATAYRRSSTTLTSYAATSNNNDFFAGTPSANNLIYTDGTNSDQTIAAYKTRVSPRDAVSFTENPPFVNVGSVPYDLHMQTTVQTQCESGGSVVSTPNITDDYDGNPRYPNSGYPNNGSSPAGAPDVGADEFGGLKLDLMPPGIAFTALLNTYGTGARTLTTTITDASGVPTAGIGLPVLYWKINSGSYSPATGVFVSGSTYTFTFGGGVVLDDVVSYYIVAQDLVTPTPNVGSNPPAGASGFTFDPPACSTPPTTPYTYLIVGSLSGNYTIGPAGNYTTLTGAGGLFADLNSKVVTGNITATIVSNFTEPGTNALNQMTEEPSGSNFTLTVKPDGTTTRVVTGTFTGSLIRLNGADNVTFDGRFGGSGNYLTFSNTSTSGAVFLLSSLGAGAGATNNTIRNCNINMGGNASGTYGISVGGASAGATGADNDNVAILNNVISKAYVGIWAEGNAVTNPGLMDNLQIIGNSLGSALTTDYLGHDGIIVAYGINGTISQNTVYNIITTNTTPVGITLTTGFISATVSRNNVNNVKYTGTAGYGGRGLYINTGNLASSLNINNNLFYLIGGDGFSSFSGSSPVGMYFDGAMGGLNIYYNSVYMSGALTYSGVTWTTAILFNSASMVGIDFRDNIFENTMDNAAQTTDKNWAIYSLAPSSSFTNINYNDYYASGPQAVLGYFGGSDRLTIAAWRTATGQDANSPSVDPQFVSTTDLRINLGSSVIGAGTPISSVNFDYLNVIRSASNPTLGAYEGGGDYSGPAIAYTPLLNTSSLSNRTLSNVAITDYSGVNVTSGTRPRIYYKRSTDGNVWNSNTSGTDGWKYTETGGTTTPFSFTMDYSLLFGGTGVSVGTSIQYFVIAQDLQSSPLVGINSGVFAATPSSVALTAAAFPITGTINSYVISQAFSGTISIGAGQTYTSLTNDDAAGFFKAINNGVLTANLIVNVVSDMTAETGVVALNQWAEEGAGNYTLTIQPSAAANRIVSGSYTGGLIRLNGTDRLIIDGRFGGSGNYLTFTNTVTTGTVAAIQVISLGAGLGATNNTIRNCNVSAGFNTSGAYGIVMGGATVASTGADNDNNSLLNNNISKAYVGLWAEGTTITNPGLMDNLQVIGNSIGSTTSSDYIGHDGMIIAYGTGCTISQNTIFNIITTATTPVGMTLSTGFVSSVVNRNKIHDIVYASTGGWGARGMYVNTGNTSSSLNISNNQVYVIGGDGYSSFAGSSPVGMYFDGTMGGLNIYFNSVYMSGVLTYSGITLTTAILFNTATITTIDLRNNIFMNAMDNVPLTTDKNYAIYSTAPASSFTFINYNDYYVTGAQGILGYLGADQLTLASWQAATGQDANSKNLDPLFVSTTDLHASASGLDNQGIYLPAVTIDFDEITRTNPPDIGAYEFGTNPIISTTTALSITCEGATLNGLFNANTLSVNTYFDYGQTTAYGASVSGVPSVVTGSTPTPVAAFINGLIPNTTYHYRVRGVTTGNVTSYGNDVTFVTSTTGAPIMVTLEATDIGMNSATLNGTAVANCNSTVVTFEYGLTTGYGTIVTAIQSPVNGAAVIPVNVYISGLITSTLYHFRVVGNNSQGTVYGSDMTFTSGASAPTVFTDAATDISYFSAQINGTVTANNQTTAVTFEWGLTGSYGNTINGIPPTVAGATPTPVYASLTGLTHNTTYHFRCVGQNATGTTYGSDMIFTTLCRIPDAAGAISGPDSLCQSTSGHVYSIPPVPYATGYVWTLPPGGVITAGANTNSITVSYSNSATSGNVTVYGSNVCGNGTSSSLAVAIYPLPVPTITGTDPACVGSRYNYTTQTGKSGYIWAVSAGGQVIEGAGTNTIKVQWNSTGAQWVSVTYTSEYGCPAASPTVKTINVSALPVPTIAGSNYVCVSQELHVYTTQSGYNNYVWTVTSGGTITSGQGTYQIEVDWHAAGNQTVTVNYTNASGCSAMTPGTFAVTVNPLPGTPDPITGAHDVCAGEEHVTYSVTEIPDALNYIWTLPEGATIINGDSTNIIEVNFSTSAVSGNISVHGENLCGAGPSSPLYAVSVHPIPPTPVASVDEFYMLHSSAPAGNQWYLDGNLIDGANGQDYQAEVEGFYWTVVTLEGCFSAESNHVEVIFVGVPELNGSSFNIHPVPNDGKFTATIVIPNQETFSISVFNEMGMKVFEIKDVRVDGKAQQDIVLNDPATGIYTVVFQGNKQTAIRKILVTR